MKNALLPHELRLGGMFMSEHIMALSTDPLVRQLCFAPAHPYPQDANFVGVPHFRKKRVSSIGVFLDAKQGIRLEAADLSVANEHNHWVL